ncbi:MAG: tetratricopeptide repeat protein [Caulobacteraceae bacterium]
MRAFLLQHGDHPEAMRLLAKIGLAHDVLDDAELLLGGVLALAPRPPGRPLRIRRHPGEASQAPGGRAKRSSACWRWTPGNLDFRSLAATIAVGLGEHDRAIELYRGMLIDAPTSPDLHLWIAHALKTVGRTDEAIGEYRAAAAARPDFGDAYWSLANLKTYRFADDEIAAMRGAGGRADHLAGRPPPPVLRAGQGAGGPRRDRRILDLLRARQRPEAGREPLSP